MTLNEQVKCVWCGKESTQDYDPYCSSDCALKYREQMEAKDKLVVQYKGEVYRIGDIVEVEHQLKRGKHKAVLTGTFFYAYGIDGEVPVVMFERTPDDPPKEGELRGGQFGVVWIDKVLERNIPGGDNEK